MDGTHTSYLQSLTEVCTSPRQARPGHCGLSGHGSNPCGPNIAAQNLTRRGQHQARTFSSRTARRSSLIHSTNTSGHRCSRRLLLLPAATHSHTHVLSRAVTGWTRLLSPTSPGNQAREARRRPSGPLAAGSPRVTVYRAGHASPAAHSRGAPRHSSRTRGRGDPAWRRPQRRQEPLTRREEAAPSRGAQSNRGGRFRGPLTASALSSQLTQRPRAPSLPPSAQAQLPPLSRKMVAATTPAGCAYQLGGPVRPRRHAPTLHAPARRPRGRSARGAVHGEGRLQSGRVQPTGRQASPGRAGDLNSAAAALIGYASGHVTRRRPRRSGLGLQRRVDLERRARCPVPGTYRSAGGRAGGRASWSHPPALEPFPSPFQAVGEAESSSHTRGG